MAEEKQGTPCPICEKGVLKVNANKTIVHCSEQKSQRDGKEFIEVGECSFKMFFNQQKYFSKTLTANDIRKLCAGEGIKNSKGDVMFLDKTNEQFFTRIEYAEKKPDTLL